MIRQIVIQRVDIPLTRPYKIAFRSIEHVTNFIVSVEGETGIVGLGAASPEPFVTGESIEACGAALDAVVDGPLLQEASLPAARAWLREHTLSTPAACAALDMAVFDLEARLAGMPLASYLGGVQHNGLLTSITIGIKPVQDTIEEGIEYKERGFRIIKLKLGESFETDLERLAKLREAVGPTVKIRVDMNQGYGVEDLRRFFQQARPYDFEFAEQPLKATFDDVKSLTELSAEDQQLVCLDEVLQTDADANAAIALGAPFGIFNIKLMKSGGVTTALRIADIAAMSEIDLMWGCMDESCISIAAALHAAYASQRTRYIDLDGSFDLAKDVAEGGFVLKDGCLFLTDKVGLGVSLTDP